MALLLAVLLVMIGVALFVVGWIGEQAGRPTLDVVIYGVTEAWAFVTKARRQKKPLLHESEIVGGPGSARCPEGTPMTEETWQGQLAALVEQEKSDVLGLAKATGVAAPSGLSGFGFFVAEARKRVEHRFALPTGDVLLERLKQLEALHAQVLALQQTQGQLMRHPEEEGVKDVDVKLRKETAEMNLDDVKAERAKKKADRDRAEAAAVAAANAPPESPKKEAPMSAADRLDARLRQRSEDVARVARERDARLAALVRDGNDPESEVYKLTRNLYDAQIAKLMERD